MDTVRIVSRSLRRIGLCAALMLLAGCGSAVSPSPSSAPSAAAKASGWNELVEAARKEGAVVVYGPPGAEYRPVLVDAFQKAYPGVKVDGTFAETNDRANRLIAERTANKTIADVLIDGTINPVTGLKEAKVLIPLAPALLLPEVTDTSKWLQNRLWWADSSEPNTTLMFQGGVNNIVSYNTKQVNPAEFSSYWDLLNPKWKGKIVGTDIRRPGPGGVPSRFMYKHPDLGPNFFTRFYSESGITLSSDQRQMIDWLAEGRYALGLFMSDIDVQRAAEQSLPVATMPSDRFKEGAAIGPAYGAVGIVDRAPHPNAAKLYVNWLLSAEGQTAWQREVKGPSLRTDISKDGLPSHQVPKPGGSYVNAGTEEYARLTPSAIRDLISQALEKAGQQ